MGLLDEVNEAMGSAAPGGNLTKPLMIALGALLVGKMMSGGSASAAPAASSADGGLLGGVGGLLDKLKDAGHGDKVDSWVGGGVKKPIAPGELGAALGPNTVSSAAQQANVSEQQLLSMLAQNLPQIIGKLTAGGGGIPSLQTIATALTQK
jgi:uncharacterized protein YidB (DUF937 family)